MVKKMVFLYGITDYWNAHKSIIEWIIAHALSFYLLQVHGSMTLWNG